MERPDSITAPSLARALRRAARRVAPAALAVAALVAAREAALAKPQPPQFAVDGRSRVLVGSPLSHVGGTYVLDVDGEAARLDLTMDRASQIRGLLRVDGSELDLRGRTSIRGRKQVLTLSGKGTLDGRADSTISLALTLGPGGFAGKANFARKRDGLKLRKAPATGAGPSFGARQLGVILDLVETRPGAITGAGWVDTPAGRVRIETARGTSSAAGTADRVVFTAKGDRTSLRFTGRHDGTRFTGAVSGKAGDFPVKRAPVNFAVAPVSDDPPTVALVDAFADVVLEDDGRVPADVTVTAGTGPELFIPEGTRLRKIDGEPLTGEVRIRIVPDDPDAPPVPGLVEPLTSGVIVIEGGGIPIPAVAFDNVALLRVDLLTGLEGGGSIELGVLPPDGFIFGTAPAPSAPKRAFRAGEDEGAPDGYSPVGGWKSAAQKHAWELRHAQRIALYEAQKGAAGDVEGDQVFEIEIPGDDTSEYPRVKDFEVIEVSQVKQAVELLGIVSAPGGTGGLTVGESIADSHGNYAFSVVGRGGKRYVSVRTRYLNRIKVRVIYCLEGGDDGTAEGVPDPSPPVEEDPDGPYNGTITVLIDGWGEYDDWYEFVRVRLPGVFTGDVTVVPRQFDAQTDSTYKGTVDVVGYEGAVSTIAAKLGAGFEVIGDESRFIHIRQTCPPPIACVLGFDTFRLYVLGLSPLEVLRDVDLGERPGGVVVSPSGRDAWATVGGHRLVRVDPLRGHVVRSREIPGLTPSVGLDPAGRFLYVTSSDTGTFTALDPRTLETLWELPGFPAAFHSPMTLSPGGGRVWFASPLTSQILRADLLNRVALPPFARSVQSVALSHLGDRLVVVDLQAGAVRIVDAGTGGLLISAATGSFPIYGRWSPDDQLVLTGNQGNDTFTVLNVETSALTQITGIDGPEPLDTYTDASGAQQALVGGFQDRTLHRIDLNTLGGSDTAITVDFQPSAIDVSGR